MDRYRDADWLEVRAEAEEVECPYCEVPKREHCINPRTGFELGKLPAHAPRIKAAKEQGDD